MRESMPSLSDLVLRHSPAGIAVFEGKELCVRDANPAFLSFLRLSEAAIGQPLRRLLPALPPAMFDALQAALSTGRNVAYGEVASAAVLDDAAAPRFWDATCLGLGDGLVALMLHDVTESVRARQQLAEQEQWLRMAQELSVVGFVIMRALRDAAGRIEDFAFVYANRAALQANRMQPADIGRRTLRDVFPVPANQALLDKAVQVVDTGETADFDICLQTEDGERWYRELIIKVGDGLAASFIDITDRRQVQQALETSEARVRLALNAAPISPFTRDRDLRLTWVYNPAAVASGNTYLGKLPRDGYHPDDAAVLEEDMRQVMESGIGGGRRQQVRLHDGRVCWFDVYFLPLRDDRGNVVGITGAVHDVTAAAEAQRQLKEAEERLQIAVEAANMGAWEQDLARREVRHTRSLMTLYGLPPSEGPTPIGRFAALIPEQDRQQLAKDYRQAIQKGKELRSEFRIRRPDGELRWMQLCGRALHDERGKAYKLVGVTLDITSQRQIRERLDHFARTVAHDLKAPLRAMTNFSGLLKRLAGNRLEPQAQRYIEQILYSGRQMNELIDGLLQYAQSTPGDRIREPVALEQVLRQALEQLEPAIEETAARIEHRPLPVVSGNRVLLTQVLQNLIGNALKFRASGPPRIRISAERQGEQWVIAVQDNGIGIPEGWQERLFEPFLRAHREQGFAGLGLGLALVKDIIEDHGGRIWVKSAPEGGTTFYFTLPTADEPALRS